MRSSCVIKRDDSNSFFQVLIHHRSLVLQIAGNNVW